MATAEVKLVLTRDEIRILGMCVALSGHPVHIDVDDGKRLCAYSGTECGEWRDTRWLALKSLYRALQEARDE